MRAVGAIFVAGLLVILAGCQSGRPVKDGDVQIKEGGADKDAIREVIRGNIVQVRHCYEKESIGKKGPEGKVVLEWDIVDKGKVANAKVKRSLDPAIDTCLVEALKTWTFPAPPEGQTVKVAFPFEFSRH